MKKVFVGLLISVSTISLLTGCSSSDIDKYTPPTDLGYTYSQMDAIDLQQITGNSTSTSPFVSVIDNNEAAVIIGGSSTCPPVIQSVTNATDGSVHVNLQDASSSVCTADFALTGFRVVSASVNFDFHSKEIFVCKNETCNLLPSQ
jgi:hypothetical protein